MTGSEQVLVEDWCQQYPSHSVGTVEFGPDGALYASGGRRRELQLRRLRAGRQPAQPVRRSARRRRRGADATDGRGRRAAQPGPAHVRRPGRRSTARSSASIPRRARRCRRTRCSGSSDPNARRIIALRACAIPSASRSGRERASSGSATWAGASWEEINRIARPDGRRRRELRLALLRGHPEAAGLRRREPHASARTCTRTPSADTKPYFAYHHANKVVAGETCPTGSSSIAGPRLRVRAHRRARSRPSTRARCSSPTTRATASGR